MSPLQKTHVLVAGQQQVAAAESLRRKKRAEDAWPFAWTQAPPRSKHVFQSGFLAAPDPATGIQEVLEYRVDDGFDFCLSDLVLQVIGNWLPGDFTFSLDINSPIGVTSANTLPYKDYQNIQVTMGGNGPGAPLASPAPVRSGELSILRARDVLRVKVTNINVPIGNPQFFIAAIWGWVFPSGQVFGSQNR